MDTPTKPQTIFQVEVPSIRMPLSFFKTKTILPDENGNPRVFSGDYAAKWTHRLNAQGEYFWYVVLTIIMPKSFSDPNLDCNEDSR